MTIRLMRTFYREGKQKAVELFYVAKQGTAAEGRKVAEAQEDVLGEIQGLRNMKREHLEMGKYMLKDAFFPLDFLAVATLNRSLCLIRGFCSLLEAKNMVAAAPLLRMQLDNCLRFSAAWLVKKPHEFAITVLRGTPIRKLKDQDGNLLHDRYLVERLTAEYPWVEAVYQNSSGYVHLSEKHIFNCLTVSKKGGQFQMKITDEDSFVPDDLYLEAIEAFKAATDILLKFAHGWAFTKANPEIIRKGKAGFQ